MLDESRGVRGPSLRFRGFKAFAAHLVLRGERPRGDDGVVEDEVLEAHIHTRRASATQAPVSAASASVHGSRAGVRAGTCWHVRAPSAIWREFEPREHTLVEEQRVVHNVHWLGALLWPLPSPSMKRAMVRRCPQKVPSSHLAGRCERALEMRDGSSSVQQPCKHVSSEACGSGLHCGPSCSSRHCACPAATMRDEEEVGSAIAPPTSSSCAACAFALVQQLAWHDARRPSLGSLVLVLQRRTVHVQHQPRTSNRVGR